MKDFFIRRHLHGLFHVKELHLHFIGATQECSAFAARNAARANAGGPRSPWPSCASKLLISRAVPTRSEGSVEFLRKMSTSPDVSDAGAEREFFEKHRAASLLQRLIDPSEVAHMVSYLASLLSSATNGAARRVEGGLLRQVG